MKNRGVTLLALAIAIVVLLILLAITIRLTIGEKGTVIKAKEAVSDHKLAERSEKEVVDDYNNQLRDLMKGTENQGLLKKEDILKNKDAVIGKRVTGYIPKIEEEYADTGYVVYEKYTGNNDQTFETEQLNWKVWSIDKDNIYLISETPTSADLSFGHIVKEVDAYNNGVEVLNDICKVCYTDRRYRDVEARSMNIEDIEKLYDEKIMTYNYKENEFYNKTYTGTKIFGKEVPLKYFDDEKNTIIERSKIKEYIESGSNNTKTLTSAHDFTSNCWDHNFGLYNDGTDFRNDRLGKEYKKMIFEGYDSSTYKAYYLATRGVYWNDYFFFFGIMHVSKGSIGTGHSFKVDNNPPGAWMSGNLYTYIRPIARVGLDCCDISWDGYDGSPLVISPK